LVFHTSALCQTITGQAPLQDSFRVGLTDNDFPHLGAQLAFKGPKVRGRPVAVSLPNAVGEDFTIPGQNGGFLGATYAPLCIDGDPSQDTFTGAGLTVSADFSAQRLQDRKALLQKIDGTHSDRMQGQRALEHMDAYHQRAVDVLLSHETRTAANLTRESPRLRDHYGRHKYGQSLLLARRLIEASVRLVTVYWGGRVNNPLPYWDTHRELTSRLKNELLPPFDQCFPAFLEDLNVRGLLSRTLVLCLGEFGRTPRFGAKVAGGSNATGRDHWPYCYSIVIAGGRAEGGRVLGRSDSIGAYPLDNPYQPQDLATTILQKLGVKNPHEEIPDRFNRMVPLTTGRFCPELFGG
jgi:hypothetical protein